MALLALDLIVLGSSGYLMWERIKKHTFSSLVPTLSLPEKPPLAADPRPPAATQTPMEKEPNLEINSLPAAKEVKSQSRMILFKYRDSVPKKVMVTGEFNRWKPAALKKNKQYVWSITLKIMPGSYAYNFIVDNRMIRDPANPKTKNAGKKILSSLLVVKSKGQ